MRTLSKKLCLILLTFSTTTFAGNDDHFYIAANAGIFQVDFDNKYLDQTDIIQQNISQTAQQHGYTGGIAIGYSRSLSADYFLGAELSANLDSHNASFQSGAASSAFSDQTQINNHINLTFVPGIKLNQSIYSYLKVGLSYAALEDHLSSPAGFDPVITNYHSNRNTLGFTAGLGIAKSLTEHIALFVEGNYYDYGNVDFSNFQNFSASYTHSTRVFAYEVTVGAAYSI